jgi:hypothetical protein
MGLILSKKILFFKVSFSNLINQIIEFLLKLFSEESYLLKQEILKKKKKKNIT